MAGDPHRDPFESVGVEELRQRTLLRVLTRLLRLRRLFAPLLLGFALWIGLSDAATWRRILMFVAAGLLSAMIVHDIFVTRGIRTGRLSGPTAVVPNLLVVALMQHVMIFATGGMASPLLPLVLPVMFLTGLVSERRTTVVAAFGIQLPALAIEAALQLGGVIELTPTILAGPDGGSPQSVTVTILLALVMGTAVVVTAAFSRLSATSLNAMIGEALRARDSALATRNHQTRELTTLSGEIAHELKNPLASVKGLAQLVSRELERDGAAAKSAERMEVLRREVDRMQTILEEFLNFSRPLVPLSQREIELRELVDHVVDLHEGMAGERRVELRARGHARASCDPRKVEQILINLVQNALEAAPLASEIELEVVDAQPEEVRVHVRDRGPGLAASVRERVFEPGVTAKREGSGLGLTIARALARQHGGELELDDRRDRAGCEAILRLPICPPQPEQDP